jgi:hypothetical protein
MSKLSSALLLALLCALGPAAAPAAAACLVDADCDNGDTCAAPDQCVAGSCVLGGGGDTNGDFVCDGEFDPDADVKITKVVAKTSALAGRDVVRGSGDFIELGSAGGAFTADDGIAIRVKDQLSALPPDGDGFDVTLAFASGECDAAGTGVSCVLTTGPHAGTNAKFKRNPFAANQLRFTFKMKGLNMQKPFFGPVRILLTHGTTTHRLGLVTDCKLFKRGIKCREF